MTRSELFKLHELKGRLRGREICLESDIASLKRLVCVLRTELYIAECTAKLETLEEWARDNARLQEEVERIIKEAENDRQ